MIKLDFKYRELDSGREEIKEFRVDGILYRDRFTSEEKLPTTPKELCERIKGRLYHVEWLNHVEYGSSALSWREADIKIVLYKYCTALAIPININVYLTMLGGSLGSIL